MLALKDISFYHQYQNAESSAKYAPKRSLVRRAGQDAEQHHSNALRPVVVRCRDSGPPGRPSSRYKRSCEVLPGEEDDGVWMDLSIYSLASIREHSGLDTNVSKQTFPLYS